MAIVINGSGTVTGLAVGGLPDGIVDSDTLASNAVVTGKIADGTIANADINSSAAIAGSKLVMPTGSVLQVVSTTITDNVSFGTAASDAWVDIKSLAITPSATSSKILIIWSFLGSIGSGNYPGLKTQWLRDSTVIYGPTRLENYYGVPTASNTGIGRRGYLSGNYLDSPNTTSAVTYKIQGDNNSGSANTGTYAGEIVAGSGGADTAITLMEIAG